MRRNLIKTFLRRCAPGEISDQPAHSHSLIKMLMGVFWIVIDAFFHHANNKESYLTARMRRLI